MGRGGGGGWWCCSLLAGMDHEAQRSGVVHLCLCLRTAVPTIRANAETHVSTTEYSEHYITKYSNDKEIDPDDMHYGQEKVKEKI